jgi:hypothetical protein
MSNVATRDDVKAAVRTMTIRFTVMSVLMVIIVGTLLASL